MAVELTNHQKAIWNAKATGISALAPILNEIYEKQSALEARIAELEAKQKPVGREPEVFVDKPEPLVGRMAPVYSNDPRWDVIRRMPLTIAFEGGNIVTINNGKPKCR